MSKKQKKINGGKAEKPFRKVFLNRGTVRAEGQAYNRKVMTVAGYLDKDGFSPIAAYAPERGVKLPVIDEPSLEKKVVAIDNKEGKATAVLRIEAPITRDQADDGISLRIINLSEAGGKQVDLRPGEVVPMVLSDDPKRREAQEVTLYVMNKFAGVRDLFCVPNPGIDAPQIDSKAPSRPQTHVRVCAPRTGLMDSGKGAPEVKEVEEPFNGIHIPDIPDPAAIESEKEKAKSVEEMDEFQKDSCIRVKGEGDVYLYVPLSAIRDAIASSVRCMVKTKNGYVQRSITDRDIAIWNKMARQDAVRHERNLQEVK